MSRYDLVIFDWDGTLMDSTALIATSLQEACRDVGCPVPTREEALFVIGLNIAFALPIILRIRAGSSFESGAWSLGRHYRWISPLAVAWIAFICVVGILPVSPDGVPGAEEFNWEVVNFSPITVVGALVLFGGWYLISARKWFTGPIREAGSDAELADIERELHAP